MKQNEVYYINQDFYEIDEIYKKIKLVPVFDCIKPGMTVLLKPNLIRESHYYNKRQWVQIITNNAIIAAVAKVVIRKLAGKGKIIIADGPGFGADIEKIKKLINIEFLKKICMCGNINFEFIDLREFYVRVIKEFGVYHKKLKGDPKGSVIFNLTNDDSEFSGHKKDVMNYYGTDYDIEEVNRAHDGKNNLYKVSKSVIESDVFINLPKMKTHKKAGITCSLKNLVGINTYRNYLPHHTQGYPQIGGDQFPAKHFKSKVESNTGAFIKNKILTNFIMPFFFIPIKPIARLFFGDTRDTIRSGNWYGNDTIWRMILDLNKILLCGRSDGTLVNGQKKPYISIVDGIIGGDGNGPMAPEVKRSNCIIIGTNPVAVDCVCAKIMGFDYKKIPTLHKSFAIQKYPIVNFQCEDICVISDAEQCNHNLSSFMIKDQSIYSPHFGWKGHIELDNSKSIYSQSV